MYTHLAVKSDYSFMNAASNVKQLLAHAKSLGCKSLALTDLDSMAGAYTFSKEAKALGIKPIIGCQLPMKFKGIVKTEGYLTFLAQNEQGYKNICRLMSRAQSPNEEGQPGRAVTVPMMKEFSQGVIVLSGGQSGLLPAMIQDDLEAIKRAQNAKTTPPARKAPQLVSLLQSIYRDRFYLQVDRVSSEMFEDDIVVDQQIVKLSKSDKFGFTYQGKTFKGVPLVATSDVAYTTPDRHDGFEILRAIDANTKVDVGEEGIIATHERGLHMFTPEEMEEVFADIPYALVNADVIADRCDFAVSGRDPILPTFPGEDGRSEIEELRAQSHEGLDARLQKIGVTDPEEVKKYRERLDYELSVIDSMGFPGYFLIVSDFIKWAKKNDIPVGPGRGSGAGSMVAWALLITDLNPFQFGLLFERFLNPERVSMPDFDVDFCQDRREEVIEYVREKYGNSQVALISTFLEFKSKNAIKDTGRALTSPEFGGYGFGELNEITNIIPKKEGSADFHKLKDATNHSDEFAAAVNGSQKMKILHENSMKIEGLLRQPGAHAAGVIIGDRALDELVPIRYDETSHRPLTQFDMKAAESCGLVKFDFLGLKTLSVIQEAINNIEKFHGEKVDISAISLEDPDVYKMLAEGRSIGVFQFESEGMQNVLRDVNPTRIEDLIAVAALYRPGPMDQIPHYADCKNGKAEPRYPKPVEATKPFLEETFGIMIYQEQVMRVAQEVAGYSLGGADLLRRAMGKKIPEEMDKQRVTFVEGATERGATKKEANELFDTIAKFAGYGFNKSHAAAYAYIAYQTAWLKYHYPACFFSALLSFEIKDVTRMALIKDDMSASGIDLLPPNITKSYPRFRPEPSETSTGGWGIRFGLTGIKSISGNMPELVKELETKPFTDLEDMVRRTSAVLNKSKYAKLAEVGAFDCFDKNRNRALAIINWHLQNMKGNSNQITMFGDMISDDIPEKVLDVKDWGNRFEREFNAVGFYFNKHPIDYFVPKLMKVGVKSYSDLKSEIMETHVAELSMRRICCMVEAVQKRTSQYGKTYLFMRLTDRQDSFSALFFENGKLSPADAYERLTSLKNSNTPVVLTMDIATEGNGRYKNVVRNVADVNLAVSGVRGDLAITIDVNEIQDLPETARKRLEAKRDLDKGKISMETYTNIIAVARAERIKAKLGTINDYLGTLKSDGPDTTSVQISLVEDDEVFSQKKLRGRFEINPEAEARLKSFDGVVDVFETVTG